MEWISVEDRLPDEYGWFLVRDDYLAGREKITMGFFEGKFNKTWTPLDQREKIDSMVITHWMPLPEPPKEK